METHWVNQQILQQHETNQRISLQTSEHNNYQYCSSIKISRAARMYHTRKKKRSLNKHDVYEKKIL